MVSPIEEQYEQQSQTQHLFKELDQRQRIFEDVII